MNPRPQRWCIAALTVTVCVGAIPYAEAQTRSTLIGTIRDGAGAAIHGVSVSLDGPSDLSVAHATQTDRRGGYRFPALPSGQYELTASLQGWQTVKRTGLRLPVGTTLTLDLTLGPAEAAGAVTMNGAGPIIDVTTAASTITFSREELESLPIGGVAGLLQFAPGIGRSILGAGPDTNQLLIDGSPTVLMHRSNSSANIHPYWIDEVQVVSLGADAHAGEFSGAVTRLALKSGSNRLSGLMEYRTTRPGAVANNTGSLSESLQVQFRPQKIISRWAANAQAGGPIVRDRVFVFSGFQYSKNKFQQAGTIGDVPQDTQTPNALARLTWMASPNLKMEGFLQRDSNRTTGALGRNQLPETAGEFSSRVYNWNQRLTWTPSPRTTVEVRASGLDFQTIGLPQARRAGPSPRFDRITQIRSANATRFDDTFAGRVLASAAVRRLVDGLSGGSHDLEVGFEHDRTKFRVVSGFPGGRSHTDALGVPDEVLVWDGDSVASTGARTVLYAQDTWHAGGRVTIHPGVRLAVNRGSVPDRGTVFKTQPVSPRLGVAWDVASDHKTVVRAGYGRFHEGLYTTVYDFLNTSALTPVIRYDVLPGGTLQELQRTATTTLALDDNVAHAYVEQFVIGVERQLFASVSVKAQYARRNFEEIWAFVDRGSQYAPVQRRDPGPDGLAGTGDDGAFLTLSNLLNPGQTFPVLTNPDGAVRRYDSAQLVGEKRMSDTWQMLAAYTWSRTRGTVNAAGGEHKASGGDTGRNGVFANPNRAINAEGLVAADVPHQVNVQGTYLFPVWGGVTVSGGYRYVSGVPWGRTAMIGLAQGNQLVRIEPRGTHRTDALSQFDMRFEKAFPLRAAARTLGIYVDAFNLTNQGVATSVQDISGATFGQPGAWFLPRTIQVAVRVKF